MVHDYFGTIERESLTWIDAMDRHPLIGSILRGDASRNQYIGFLGSTYHYIQWSAPLLAETAQGLRRCGRHPWLLQLLDAKTDEESPHDRWVLNDLKRNGGDVKLVTAMAAPPAVLAYVKWSRTMAREGSPAFPGAAYSLEILSMHRATMAAENLIARRAIPNIESAVSFLGGHGDADVDHVALLADTLRRIEDPRDQAAIARSAAVVRVLYHHPLPRLCRARACGHRPPPPRQRGRQAEQPQRPSSSRPRSRSEARSRRARHPRRRPRRGGFETASGAGRGAACAPSRSHRCARCQVHLGAGRDEGQPVDGRCGSRRGRSPVHATNLDVNAALAHVMAPERNRPEVEAAFEAVPPESVAEILDGELFTFPRPGRPHTRSASRLGMKLGSAFDLGDDGPGGWVILDEPELHLGPRPDKVVPDLAAWTRDRMPDALGDDDTPAHYDVAPEWVCEILSPRTERIDRGKKMRIYRREGVRHVWLLSPLHQALEVYRLEAQGWMLLETYEDDAKVRVPPFDAMELDLAEIWAR